MENISNLPPEILKNPPQDRDLLVFLTKKQTLAFAWTALHVEKLDNVPTLDVQSLVNIAKIWISSPEKITAEELADTMKTRGIRDEIRPALVQLKLLINRAKELRDGLSATVNATKDATANILRPL